MTIRDVIEDNARNYIGQVPGEFLNDVRREYFRGLAGEDESTGALRAVMFWELKNPEDDARPTEAEILLFHAESHDEGMALLDAFDVNANDDNVKRTYFELPELSASERSALESADFVMKEGEGRDIYVPIGELANLAIVRGEAPSYVRPLTEITPRQFKAGIMTSVRRE